MALRFINRASQSGVVITDNGFPYILIDCGTNPTIEPGMQAFSEEAALQHGDTVPLLIKKDDNNLLIAQCSWNSSEYIFNVQRPEFYKGEITVDDSVTVSGIISAQSLNPRLDIIISEYDESLNIDETHSGKLLRCCNSTLLTIGLSDYSAGWYVKVIREGTGTVKFTALNGCSINLNYELDITLVDRWQSAFIYSDGSNWTVIKNA